LRSNEFDVSFIIILSLESLGNKSDISSKGLAAKLSPSFKDESEHNSFESGKQCSYFIILLSCSITTTSTSYEM